MEEGHLERIRRAELEAVRNQFQPGMHVLEIGGGSGFQASILSSWGCNVLSIDIAGRNPAEHVYFPVQDYDGRKLPFPDENFDMVFSSNVLEHVGSITDLLQEIKRVLRPDGISLHILPSPTWRFWTSVTHYVYAFRWLLGVQPAVPGAVEPVPVGEVKRRYGILSVIKQALLAGAHGEYPNALSELYYFSRRRWRKLLEGAGFSVIGIQECGVFHTGYAILPDLSICRRKGIAKWFGSSCFAITSKKKSTPPNI